MFGILARRHSGDGPHRTLYARWVVSGCLCRTAALVSFFEMAGFVHIYLRPGGFHLIATAFALRTLLLMSNFITGVNVNFRELN